MNLRLKASCILGALILAASRTIPPAVGAPTVTPNHAAYLPGQPISIAFAGGPGNPLDWVGVYPEDVTEPDGDPASTLWNYVDNTRNGRLGLKEGTVTFPGGLTQSGNWVVYLLLNDAYTKVATNLFTVLESTAPYAASLHPTYAPGEPIVVSFTNGPANPKDWIGIHHRGQTPGPNAPSRVWLYVDGTGTGSTGLSHGTITFPAGLPEGEYTVNFLENDGYTILASDPILVKTAASEPRVISVSPEDNSPSGLPGADYSAVILNSGSNLAPASVVLRFDGAVVGHQLATNGNRITVTFAFPTALPQGSSHSYSLVHASTAGTRFTNNVTFTIGAYTSITLGSPAYTENFDGVTEDSLPAGWTELNFTEGGSAERSLENLDSASFRTWTVLDVDRFKGSFITYSDSNQRSTDYQRVLTTGSPIVVNGVPLKALASGRMLFGNSGYRNGRSQVMFLTSPACDCTGKTNLVLSFHCLMEQNQDSFASVEYSADDGGTWLPLGYYLDPRDIARDDAGNALVEETLTRTSGDIATYVDAQGAEQGGSYSAFVAAPLASIKPEHLLARLDDNPFVGKTVEVFPLPKAANQARVRFRFGLAGTDSWYFGIDDVGVYDARVTITPPSLAIRLTGDLVTVSWSTDASGWILQSATTVTGANWSPVPGVDNRSITLPAAAQATYFRLIR